MKERIGPPVQIVYGYHGDMDSRYLVHLDKTIGDSLLSKKSGKVVGFVEDAGASESRAKMVERAVEAGISPAKSVTIALFAEKFKRPVKLNNKWDNLELRAILYDLSQFILSELSIFDNHFNESKRIRLLWESRPDNELKQENKAGNYANDEIYKAALDESFVNIAKGCFKQGLVPFKRATEDRARANSKRNERFALRIEEEAQKGDVACVVGYIGANHTKIGHILSRRGHTVTKIFAGKEGRQFMWPSKEIASRRREFFPNEDLIDLDWYCLMIGNAIENINQFHAIEEEMQNGVKVSYQKILEQARSFIARHLKDMESVLEFESDVRKSFREALADRGIGRK